MATSFSSSTVHFLFLLLFVFISFSNAQPPTNAGIIFDLERDPSTLQYMVKIIQGTPQAEVKLVVDLAGGELPWFNCHEGYDSSSMEPIICTSPICFHADKPVGTCAEPDSETCSINVRNPVTRSIGQGELISDIVTVTSNPDSQATPVPSSRSFAFGCAASSNILAGLATTSKGVAGLGRASALSLPSQFADGFQFPNIFAVDLHDSIADEKVFETSGKIYFGGGPYIHFS
ncbi:basic 7S globulin-like [Papaver somniferum]|uniref:basic 7S globulin-like n=1 Tax=Papaver somniferum TaxID=3469 RepID=UPI000E6F6ADA|nr:basic 7S globulin-like [Papaver somniferum]